MKRPVYFVTSVTKNRQPILAKKEVMEILLEEWTHALSRYGWAVGEFVIMPDHIHFFARPATENSESLSEFIGKFKSWSARRISRFHFGQSQSIWQDGFFDRLLRNEREWEEKRLYTLDNPVRAGLTTDWEGWPFQGDLDMFRT